MKTENLTFLEAVKALQEGRCEGFKRPRWENHVIGIALHNDKVEWEDTYDGWFTGNDLVAADYVLVNPPTEEREVKRWICTKCGWIHQVSGDTRCCACASDAPLEPFTGTYRAPVEEKERKSVTTRVQVRSSDFYGLGRRNCPLDDEYVDPASAPPDGIIGTPTFEWEE